MPLDQDTIDYISGRLHIIQSLAVTVLKDILVERSGEKVASERLGVYAKAMEESAKVAMENLGSKNPRHQLMAQGQMH